MARERRRSEFVSSATRGRHIGEFRSGISQGKRRNPESLRSLLFEILTHEYKGDLKAAAANLERAKYKRKGRSLQITFTDNVLYDIINDRTHIKFGHLDAFAQQLKVPTAYLLLFSRLFANERDQIPADSIEILRGFIEFCNSALDKVIQHDSISESKTFNYENFHKWALLFSKQSDQLDLFDDVWAGERNSNKPC